jgi:glutamine amidotransferase
MQKVAIIDYGMGNLHSVASAVQHVAPDTEVCVTSDHAEVCSADRVIFPGVGAIRDCMGEIRKLGFDALVASEVASGKPMLAICVGMQALMRHSSENDGVDCLGIFDADVTCFSDNDEFGRVSSRERLKVPHMGWNQVHQDRAHPLWHGIAQDTRFYFVHSYFVSGAEPDIACGSTEYGLRFNSVLARDNLFATQFHPEKSHSAGLALLKNFVAWNGQA